MFLAPAKRRAELCLRLSELKRQLLQRAVTALERRLTDTSALLSTIRLQLEAESQNTTKRSKPAERQRRNSFGNPADLYASFAKPPTEVIVNDKDVLGTAQDVGRVETRLEVGSGCTMFVALPRNRSHVCLRSQEAQRSLLQLNTLARLAPYEARRLRLLRVLTREAESPTLPDVLKPENVAPRSAVVGDNPSDNSTSSRSAAPAPVVGSVDIHAHDGDTERPGRSNGTTDARQLVSGKPGTGDPDGGEPGSDERGSAPAKAAGTGAAEPGAPGAVKRVYRGPDAILFRANRVHAISSICCDTRLPEGRLLQRWCDSILGAAARLHEFDAIRFGGDTVKALLEEDDTGQFPHRHRFERRLKKAVVGAETGPASAPPSLSSPKSLRALSLRRRGSKPRVGALALLERSSPVDIKKTRPQSAVAPATALRVSRQSQRRPGSAHRATGSADRAELELEDQLPSPGFILFFLRYFTRTMLAVYGLDEDKPSLAKPMRALVDRVVYPRVLRLCFAFNDGRTAKWDRVFVRNKPHVQAMLPAAIGIEPAFRQYCAQLDGAPAAVSSHQHAQLPVKAEANPQPEGDPPRLFARATAILSQLPAQQVPADMMKILLAAVRDALDEASTRARDPSIAHSMDAETMFPILVFMCSHADWSRPNRYLAFLMEFGVSKRQVGGVEDYFVTAVAAAVAWVCRYRPSESSLRADTRAVLVKPTELPGMVRHVNLVWAVA